MRIWSIHPKYIDAKGLVALWRETLLAKNVLEGNTKGYKNHPQLIRFKKSDNPLHAINQYLSEVYKESIIRGYHFDATKFNTCSQSLLLPVTKGQIQYEMQHLLNKLKSRDTHKHLDLINLLTIEPHPLFKMVEGEMEEWEII